jgi:oligopeptide transport system substrate-binding protein
MRHWITLLCLIVCSCKPQTDKKAEQILHLNLKEEPTCTDPRQAQSLAEITLMRHLFDGLYRSQEGGATPALAQDVQISEDGKVYRFTLREALWSDGKPILASHFLDSWQAILTRQMPCNYVHLFFVIDQAKEVFRGSEPFDKVGIKALTDRILEIKLVRPLPYFLELLTLPVFFPIHPETSVLTPLFSGPFCLHFWEHQEKIGLKKNPTYWDKDHVYLNEIHFSLLQDAHTELYLFEKGELDWLGQPLSHNLSAEFLEKTRGQNGVESQIIDGTFWVKINTSKTLLSNANLRQALSFCIDRRGLIDHVLLGGQQEAGSILPPTLSLSSPCRCLEFDIKQAKASFEKFLKQSNLTAQTMPKLTLSYPSSDRTKKIVQYLADTWLDKLGLCVHLEAQESAYYRTLTRQGLYEIGVGDWIADFHDPLAFLELFGSPNEEGMGLNDTFWHHPEYTALIEEAQKTKDSVLRKQLLSQAELLLMDELPIIPLYHYAFDFVKGKHVSGLMVSPLGTTDFKSASLNPF